MRPGPYFEGKHVVVTGGSSGIGLATARALVGFGASVTLVARNAERLEAARVSLVTETPKADVTVHALDVADGDAVDRAAPTILARDVDVLVNNAGISRPGHFGELPRETFRTMMDVNYFGALHMCQAIVPAMVARGSGHVLNVGSLAGVIGIFGLAAYTPTKFALSGLSQVLRAELEPRGVRVSIAHPPETDTPMLDAELPIMPAEMRAVSGTIKPLAAEAVANAILRGAADGDFEIWCDGGSRATAFAQGVVPWLVRWFCDAAVRKVRISRQIRDARDTRSTT